MDDFDLDYVEIYVQDLAAQVDAWCGQYGFEAIATGGSQEQGFHSLVLGQGRMRVVLTEAIAEDHPAARYVLAHGDGVANIALRTMDIKRALTQVLAAGGQLVSELRDHQDDDVVLSAAVSGFDNVVHTLLQRRTPVAGLPPGFRWLPKNEKAPGRNPGPELLEIDHFAICLRVGLLNPAVDAYRKAFGFSVVFQERVVVGDQAMLSKVIRSRTGSVTFTLIQPDPSAAPGQIDEFLHSHSGSGVQHIAFSAADIVRAVTALSAAGVEFQSTPQEYYDSVTERVSLQRHPLSDLRALSILADQDHGGQLFQIFTRSNHDRRTIFFEVIERRGAETFGSANIRALYEAVEAGRAEKVAGR
ncbi:4-hydroxyphenylpyruvate dioxygenase [Longispora sp. NPDC051575]|uniref:4-hydroxyphenylpyruvate dioxygenase n=1 Tax=Longispora sp. NPDC051575 TaxID=3154943 RepID=UPI003419F181